MLRESLSSRTCLQRPTSLVLLVVIGRADAFTRVRRPRQASSVICPAAIRDSLARSRPKRNKPSEGTYTKGHSTAQPGHKVARRVHSTNAFAYGIKSIGLSEGSVIDVGCTEVESAPKYNLLRFYTLNEPLPPTSGPCIPVGTQWLRKQSSTSG